jgi:NAD(P)-dependent dehydrogenase (short-subunit alcohol dehydrogenase family)
MSFPSFYDLPSHRTRDDTFLSDSQLRMKNCMRGKLAVITGANTGIGFEVARLLSGIAGATTILACRNETAAALAAAAIRNEFPAAIVETATLDLANFSTADRFVQSLRGRPVHSLVHNAGVIAPPGPRTVDGFEASFQVPVRPGLTLGNAARPASFLPVG